MAWLNLVNASVITNTFSLPVWEESTLVKSINNKSSCNQKKIEDIYQFETDDRYF